MNKFENTFFSKYIPEGQEIRGVIHIHFIDIFSKIFLWLCMGAIIPAFVYYYSISIQNLVPFIYLEILFIFVYIKVVYDIFDWYNDVWIVTDMGVIQLVWALFKTDTKSVEFEKIEGLEVDQNGMMDKILKKGDLVIHKIGDDSFILKNATNPYRGVDFIEEINQEYEENQKNNMEHFDLIMDALGGVVENYLEKKSSKTDKHMEVEKVIKEVEKKGGTIDLR